jgi:hypothetical protein
VTPYEKTLIKRTARETGTTTSDFVRRAVNERLTATVDTSRIPNRTRL